MLFDAENLAKRLKELRKEKGLNHTQLSQEIEKKYSDSGFGVSRDSLVLYEKTGSGKKQVRMSVEVLAYIADFFGVSTDWLLGKEDYSQKEYLGVTAHQLGISESALIAMETDSSVVEALNLLFKANEFKDFLKTFHKYYFATIADKITRQVTGDLTEYNETTGENCTLSDKLFSFAEDDRLHIELQAMLCVLAERHKKCDAGNILCPVELENIFGALPKLGAIYDLYVQKEVEKLTSDVYNMANDAAWELYFEKR